MKNFKTFEQFMDVNPIDENFFVMPSGKVGDYPHEKMTEVGRKTITTGDTELVFLFCYNAESTKTGGPMRPNASVDAYNAWVTLSTTKGDRNAQIKTVLFTKQFTNEKDAKETVEDLFKKFKVK